MVEFIHLLSSDGKLFPGNAAGRRESNGTGRAARPRTGARPRKECM